MITETEFNEIVIIVDSVNAVLSFFLFVKDGIEWKEILSKSFNWKGIYIPFDIVVGDQTKHKNKKH